ncbi:MAG: FAD-binding oxidoreductase [Gammaproteobacteria bacterium]|nr:FAD-binding oxidoreductase [Gammaproteobacteria bacterium]MBU2678596.1 FAD-binding oxidoreductase [Gammaproteobacteria bacterium]NNC57562.1 FAD-binding oxidoreductase [Woeseiaceae bacterium]NNL52330.1 FAD-binding oxidoreductase [Woeseiaceae bacterium]
MKRLYDDNLYRFNEPQASYWEATAGDRPVAVVGLQKDETCDVAIIGGGYTGLSAALHLARDYDIDVRVLDAGHIGWGASGRNGGFCCIGGTGVQRRDLIKLYGEENAKDFVRAQVEAVEHVRRIAAEENLEIQASGAAELEVAHTPKAFDRLQDDHELLTNTYGVDSEIVGADEFRERYYDSTEQFGALISRPGFALHPLRYCKGLANAAVRHGATLHEHSEVLEWRKGDDGLHRLVTAGGAIKARRVVFATNGFMPEQLKPEFYGRTMPVVSAIVVTRELDADERAAQQWRTDHPTINCRRILNYFRLLPDNRFLFGGRGHTNGDARGERRNYEDIISTFHRIWPAWSDVAIEYRWHGLICMTSTFCPSLGQLEDDSSVFFSYGYHGNGVNTASWSGKQLADWIGNGRSPQLPEIVKGLGRKYPLPGLRMKYLQLGIGVSAWLDRRS